MENSKWLLVENKGHIDVNALVLMGGSTKRDSSSAIGFFGSGNKYSLALLLKNGIRFRVFSGENEITITTKAVEFRDKKFDQIFINEQPTSLTTDMGPQWTPWMAIREFVSNSIDEGESTIVIDAQTITPKNGYTRIYVEQGEALKDLIDNWEKYFAFDRVDAVVDSPNGKIFPTLDTEKEELILYRKGIQCYQGTARRSLYYYDLPIFEISESRVISSDWTMRRQVRNFLLSSVSKQVARNILGNAFGDKTYFESELEWHNDGNCTMSEAWKDAIGEHIIINKNAAGFYHEEMRDADGKYYLVSRQMAKAIKHCFPEIPVYGVGQDEDDTVNWRIIEEAGNKIKYLLKECLTFLDDTGMPITYPIRIVDFDKPEFMALAVRKSKEILLSRSLFDKGRKEIVMVLIEENLHLRDNMEDETRAFQTHLIRLLVSEKEERFGIFL